MVSSDLMSIHTMHPPVHNDVALRQVLGERIAVLDGPRGTMIQGLKLKEAEFRGDRFALLMRLHPFVASAVTIPEHLRHFAIDVSRHPDINELLLASDVLVTDYSSVIFEYALLERPMLFFAPDHESYERERGFYFDYRTGVPGPIFETTAELADHIAAGVYDLERVREFRESSFDVADGRASERVVREIVLPGLAG